MRPGRRPVGAAGLKQDAERRANAVKVGSELVVVSVEHLQKQMAVFKDKLEEFARKHKKDINKNPEFRSKFQAMTTSIGVWPNSSDHAILAQ
jgi:ESCRT-II complex subunit VPS22